jgi:outer membrane protein TolC
MAIAKIPWTPHALRIRRVAGMVTAAIVSAASVARAQQAPTVRIDDLLRQAVERFAQAPQSAPVPDPAGQQAAAGPTVSLTEEQAVKMALDKNLDIAVQRLNPQAGDLAVASAKAAYLPTVTSLIGDQHQTSVPVTLLTGGQQVTTSTGTVNGQLAENVPWGGGNLSVAWNNNRVVSNSFFYNYNPSFNATVSAQYTQPLLRGLRSDMARQQLAVAKVNREMSDLQLKATIANTLSSVRNAYWDLVLAIESIGIARTSVNLANQLVEEDRKRMQAGVMTHLDLVTATSQEATARHTLVVAEGTHRVAELTLKRLIVAGPDDPLWQSVIDPVDRPDDRPTTIDLEASLKRALDQRTDVAQAKQQTAANDSTLRYLRDQTRPQADLVTSYTFNGLGGTELVRASSDTLGPASFTAPVVGTIPGAYGSALSNLFDRKYPTWKIALNVTYPIGYDAAKATTARAEIQAMQAAVQTHALEVQVVSDVTNAAIAVRNAFDEIGTATEARALFQQKLDAELQKFGAGLSTNYLVVQAQKDLTDSRNAVLQAEVDYQKALVAFDRTQQTTLQSSGVTVISPNGLGLPTVGSGRPAMAAPSGAFIP